uniref:Sperm microtubule inner protein 11 n=1 Tax=Chrysemys picta bellii TaxID=8478 RepID=A0A8C3I4K6_CHRPI
MAFFGLTFLGYQEPFRERTLALEKPDTTGPKPLKGGLFHPKLPPIGPGRFDGTVHQGSYTRYREAVKQNQLQRSPNQVFRVPVTCAQDCSWWLPRDPIVRAEEATPWMTVPRHPLIRSPMTRFWAPGPSSDGSRVSPQTLATDEEAL